MGLADTGTKVCECNQAVEDEYYFLFECVQYNNIRKELQETVQRTWLEAGRAGSLHWSVALRLAPQYLNISSNEQCQAIMSAAFAYIQQSAEIYIVATTTSIIVSVEIDFLEQLLK